MRMCHELSLRTTDHPCVSEARPSTPLISEKPSQPVFTRGSQVLAEAMQEINAPTSEVALRHSWGLPELSESPLSERLLMDHGESLYELGGDVYALGDDLGEEWACDNS